MKTSWFSLCFSGSVVRRALITALIVGILLIALNHGDAIIKRQVDGDRLIRMVLTLAVPYVVSTISSVSALMSMEKRDQRESRDP